MWRDPGLLLQMLLRARDAREMAARITEESFRTDRIPQYALAMALEQLGEAARKVSAETREAHPEIPWHRVVGLRHRIAHDYVNVDLDRIWEIVHQEIPRLIDSLESVVPPDREA